MDKRDILASMISIIRQALRYPSNCAVVSDGIRYSYARLTEDSEKIARWLLSGRDDLEEERIAFLIKPSYLYVAVQWAIWRAGGIAVPLCSDHPPSAMKYVIDDSEASLLIVEEDPDPDFLLALGNIPVMVPLDLPVSSGELPEIYPDRRAMILYTSGTTSKPKGVVSRHRHISHQMECLVRAWHWTETDYILNVLPLHHVHGIINVVGCALWAGATVEFLEKFDPALVWQKFSEGDINLFMAVPTIYYKLISHWQKQPAEVRRCWSESASKFRLMVSGSAALPVAVLQQWQEISGHLLLERYGMTEIGMALSNPYTGERRPGHVGLPLPGVEVRLMEEEGIVEVAGNPGEIQVRGASVFDEYWQRPDVTAQAFTPDGWFRTGDIARVNDGYYQILGRDSVDIIKSGGYKISALEIEEVLRSHPAIRDCAVVGLPDPEWGEIIGAALVTSEKLNPDDLKDWLRKSLPSYKIPRRYLTVDDLPRNTIGKVIKNEVVKLLVGGDEL